VLDLCTGSGVLAVCAARQGARKVTAVDISRLAVMNARINARLNGVAVTALRSDLFSALGGERYDVIVSNPPYVPSESRDLPSRGLRRAWEAGLDGRALLDRVIAEAPQHLCAGGILLVVHSDVCGDEATRDAMRAGGLIAQVVTRQDGPLGPLMRARVDDLQARRALRTGRPEEQVLVIAGRHD
jgi:release factor glutamine methyltransferase